MRLSPEQRAELLAIRAETRLTPASLASASRRLEILIGEEEALWLALEERLGREPPDGTPVLPEDERRAAEIFAECWHGFE